MRQHVRNDLAVIILIGFGHLSLMVAPYLIKEHGEFELSLRFQSTKLGESEIVLIVFALGEEDIIEFGFEFLV